jgi:hypothetical protein
VKLHRPLDPTTHTLALGPDPAPDLASALAPLAQTHRLLLQLGRATLNRIDLFLYGIAPRPGAARRTVAGFAHTLTRVSNPVAGFAQTAARPAPRRVSDVDGAVGAATHGTRGLLDRFDEAVGDSLDEWLLATQSK